MRASAYAYPWGVPMPVFGVAGYVLITLLIIAGPLVSSGAARLARYALAGGTVFGFGFSVYLDCLQAFVIHAYCTWCVTSGVIMTILCAGGAYVATPVVAMYAPIVGSSTCHRATNLTLLNANVQERRRISLILPRPGESDRPLNTCLTAHGAGEDGGMLVL